MDIRPGNLVATDTRIARLLESDQLYVMVYVPQDRIGQVRVGQRGRADRGRISQDDILSDH